MNFLSFLFTKRGRCRSPMTTAPSPFLWTTFAAFLWSRFLMSTPQNVPFSFFTVHRSKAGTVPITPRVNLKHLQWRLIQSEVLTETDAFDIKILRSMLCDKFDTIDYEQAKQDVKPFIRDTSQLDIWSAEFFKGITNQLH